MGDLLSVGEVRSIWTRCSAVGLSPVSRSVHMTGSECMTAVTVRMQESSATVSIAVVAEDSRL